MYNEQKKPEVKKWVRYEEGAKLYSMGIQSFMRLAKEAGAVYKIRGIALVKLEELDRYIEAFKLRQE